MKALFILMMALQPKPNDTLWRVQKAVLMKCMCTGFYLEYKGKRKYILVTYWDESPSKQMPNINEGDSLLLRGEKVWYKNKAVPFLITRIKD